MSILTINIKHELGAIVYLRTDKDQCPRVVSGYKIRPGNEILYILAHYAQENDHYDFEFSDEKDQVLTLT